MLTLILAIAIVGAGCERKRVSVQPMSPEVQAFNQLLKQKTKLVFLSYNGKWIGYDGDADVTFFEGNRVHVTRYSIGVVHYDGSYKMTGSGDIVLSLPNREWEPMQLAKDEKSLILQPAAGASEKSKQHPWWPFRLVEQGPFDEATTQP